jgi:hypothetical protein
MEPEGPLLLATRGRNTPTLTAKNGKIYAILVQGDQTSQFGRTAFSLKPFSRLFSDVNRDAKMSRYFALAPVFF